MKLVGAGLVEQSEIPLCGVPVLIRTVDSHKGCPYKSQFGFDKSNPYYF